MANTADVRGLDPLLVWVGSKSWLVPEIARLYQPYYHTHIFAEPFAGSAAVSLALAPYQAQLNDSNPYLMNFYNWIRRGRFELPVPMVPNESENYYAKRDFFNRAFVHGGDTERWSLGCAQTFYYLNRTGFRGLWRVNSKGEYNVPFGFRKYAPWDIGPVDWDAYYRLFVPWFFSYGDYTHQFAVSSPRFWFVDPPYDTDFNGYNDTDWGWGDQVRCAEHFAHKQEPVILCNVSSPRIVELYTDLGFTLRYYHATEHMRAKKDTAAGIRQEVVALKNVEEITLWNEN